jgi:hypothetical protein
MAGLLDLCFDPRVNFGRLVAQRFSCPVSPPSSTSASPFLLVASFGRSAIRLNEDSIGLLLQAAIGGKAHDFNVIHLSSSMFHFSVSCKDVGFMVYNLKSFVCKEFAVYFFISGRGGPNWRRDHALWCLEQEAKWTLVGSKSKKSFADVVHSSLPKLGSYPSPVRKVRVSQAQLSKELSFEFQGKFSCSPKISSP